MFPEHSQNQQKMLKHVLNVNRTFRNEMFTEFNANILAGI